VKPIIILTGPNEVYKRENLQKILSGIPREEIAVYYADETEPSVIFAQCYQNSLFGSHNVVVVKNPDASKIKKVFQEAMEKYLESINLETNLIVLAESLDSSLLEKAEEKGGEVILFKKPYQKELLNYTRERLEKNFIQFEPDLPHFLVSLANEELEDLDRMMSVLLSFAQSTKAISVQEAENILERSHNSNVFDLIGSIFNKQVEKALQVLEDLKLLGEPLTRVNYMLLRSAKLLWGYLSLKSKAEAARLLSIKPYEVKKLSEYARVSDLRFTSRVLELAAKIELKVKSMPEEFAYLELETFICSM
jgi:DNA polymerase-3 subunit delta